jgi:hypothetical protein
MKAHYAELQKICVVACALTIDTHFVHLWRLRLASADDCINRTIVESVVQSARGSSGRGARFSVTVNQSPHRDRTGAKYNLSI